MKEETKKTRPRSTTKRGSTRKTTTKRAPKKIEVPELNETVNVAATTPKDVVVSNNSYVECNNCHQTFEKGYTVCPHCHKRQRSALNLTAVLICACVFILGIIVFHFADKYIYNNVDDNYKESCVLVDYENLVRHPKEFKGKDVKIIGEVVSVEGYDTGFGNDMIITINANLFENPNEHLITITYKDKHYEQGFIEGDMITAYGVYDSINGNVPNIKAKAITFGK